MSETEAETVVAIVFVAEAVRDDLVGNAESFEKRYFAVAAVAEQG